MKLFLKIDIFYEKMIDHFTKPISNSANLWEQNPTSSNHKVDINSEHIKFGAYFIKNNRLIGRIYNTTSSTARSSNRLQSYYLPSDQYDYDSKCFHFIFPKGRRPN